MVCPLDEVANVCRWRELPDLYSHYGSRGIILMSFLQSWSQGVDVWGEQGMRKLWGAANIRLYGGGSNEQGFLDDISSVCGEMDTRQLTTSYNGGRMGQSRSYATRREPIFDVATLAALPRGRAVLMASGIDPVVIRTQSVLDGPFRQVVRGTRSNVPPGPLLLQPRHSSARCPMKSTATALTRRRGSMSIIHGDQVVRAPSESRARSSTGRNDPSGGRLAGRSCPPLSHCCKLGRAVAVPDPGARDHPDGGVVSDVVGPPGGPGATGSALGGVGIWVAWGEAPGRARGG